MQAHGTLKRADPISFDELRPLLDAGSVSQSTTALPDEMTLSIQAVRPEADIHVLCTVPAEYADGFGGACELGWVIDARTPEALAAARAFLVGACKRAGITVR